MDTAVEPLSCLKTVSISKGQDRPHARSGHRSAADTSSVYVFGGYHGVGNLLFRDVWQFDVTRERWKRMGSSNKFPKTVASSSVALCGTSLLVFGGSGVPFGAVNSNTLHVIDLKTGHCKEITCTGDIPEGKYGTSIAPSPDGQFYLYGGTTGSVFNSDVHCLDLKAELYTIVPSLGDKPKPRYRHEIVWDSCRFFVIGGSTVSEEYPFDTIYTFEFESLLWQKLSCKAAETDGFPCPRKFHACAKLDHKVYMSGGTWQLTDMFDDIWSLDLLTLQWAKLSVKLPAKLFFHSMTVTPAGCLYVFGGCKSLSEKTRSDEMYKMWLKVPNLSELCWVKLMVAFPRLLHLSRRKLHSLGVPISFLNRIS